MTYTREERRLYKRKQFSLPLRVRGHESGDSIWTEFARLIDVTPMGARFTLPQLTEVGRLLHLQLMMPRQFRCYDYAEDQYRIWSLVRHITFLEPTGSEKVLLDVGVGFVGKHPPASYEKDPMTRYEVASSAVEGKLLNIREHPHSAAAAFTTKRRDDARYQIPIDVRLEALATSGQVNGAENTVTEDISRIGTSVFTTLHLARGQFVRLTSSQYQTSITAVVRSCYTKSDNFTRIGLEFINAEWPLTGID